MKNRRKKNCFIIQYFEISFEIGFKRLVECINENN